MRNTVLLLAMLLTTAHTFSQKERELEFNEVTDLIEATYYHDNGVISQKGSFTIDRKLHGEWISYDREGAKVSEGFYKNGVRTGCAIIASEALPLACVAIE